MSLFYSIHNRYSHSEYFWEILFVYIYVYEISIIDLWEILHTLSRFTATLSVFIRTGRMKYVLYKSKSQIEY